MIDEWLEASGPGSSLTPINQDPMSTTSRANRSASENTERLPPKEGQHAPSSAVLRGALALLSTQPLTWTASLLASVLLPRLLGDQGLGVYAVAMGIAGLAGTVTSLGVPDYLTRHTATHPGRANQDATAALLLLIGISVPVAASLWLVLWFVGVPVASNGALAIALAGMVVGAGHSVLYSVLVGQQRHALFAWFNAVGFVVGTCASIAVLYLGGDLVRFMLAEVVVSAAVSALYWRSSGFHLDHAAFQPAQLLQLARGGIPFLGWAMALRVRNEIDVLLAGLLLREQVAGWLTAAYRIVYIPLFIPTLITTPLLPALSRHVDDIELFRHTVRQSLSLVLTLTIPLSVLLAAVAPSIPDVLQWAPEFSHSVPVIMLLAVEQPIMAVDMVLGTTLIALHQERRWLRAMILAACFNPAANLLMLPLFENALENGAIGAAIAEGITELLMLVCALTLLPRGTLDRATATLTARLVIAGLCLAGVTLVLSPISLPIAIAAGATTFLASAMALGALRQSEITALRDMALSRVVRTEGPQPPA